MANLLLQLALEMELEFPEWALGAVSAASGKGSFLGRW